MKKTDEKMKATFTNAKHFTKAHDYYAGLPLQEYFYITRDMSGKDSLIDAVNAAYEIGFRRGYNRAKKEGKSSR